MTLIIFSGYDVNEFFSWEAIQNGLVPNEIAVLRYLDAVGVSKYLSEDPCQAIKYPYTTLGTRWNNCKFTYFSLIESTNVLQFFPIFKKFPKRNTLVKAFKIIPEIRIFRLTFTMFQRIEKIFTTILHSKHLLILIYSKTCAKRPLSKRPKIVFQDQLSLNAG